MIAQVGGLSCRRQFGEFDTATEMEETAPPSLTEGDRLKLFEGMVDEYQEKVFRFACGMLGNETAAQDVAQEVFMKIWRALPQYRGDASASSWIYTIARNTCLTELKKNSRRRNVSLAQDEVQAEVEKSAVVDAETSGAGAGMDIQVMLEQLPEHYRQVLRLFYLEQRSYEEVAARLDIPIGTVKTYLHRAKKELAKINARRKGSYV